jgi:hypothetical protein
MMLSLLTLLNENKKKKKNQFFFVEKNYVLFVINYDKIIIFYCVFVCVCVNYLYVLVYLVTAMIN